MHRYESHTTLTDAWTNDNIFAGSRISRLTEPLVITSEDGVKLLLSTLCFMANSRGDRYQRELSRHFTKVIRDYGKVEQFRTEPEIQQYLLFDESAELCLLATDLKSVEHVFDARRAWTKTVNEDTPLGISLSRIANFFPEVEFGLLGSRSVDLQKEDSDLDVFISGGVDFSCVTDSLRNAEVQQLLQIIPISDKEQEQYGVKYARRFHISLEEGKRLALLRSRYILQTEAGPIDLSFSGSFSKKEYQQVTALGSKRIKKGVVEGRMINVQNSSSFPRVHVAEIDGVPTNIISMKWELQCLARSDDKVQVRGILREKSCRQMMTLEDEDDIIVLDPRRLR